MLLLNAVFHRITSSKKVTKNVTIDYLPIDMTCGSRSLATYKYVPFQWVTYDTIVTTITI